MKILIARPLEPRSLNLGLGPGIEYRPELRQTPAAAQRDSLLTLRPDILFADPTTFPTAALASWAATRANDRRILLFDGPIDTREQERLASLGLRLVTAARGSADDDSTARVSAERTLAAGATAYARARAESSLQMAGIGQPEENGGGKRALLVGAGIVNLVAALRLLELGFAVEILDRSPDPRGRPQPALMGCTHGGGNGRMSSLLEGRTFNGRATRGDLGNRLLRTVSKGGWALREPELLTPQEHRWIEDFGQVPAWQEDALAHDLYTFNQAGDQAWKRLRQSNPDLFAGVRMSEGILALYGDPVALMAARRLNEDWGALERAHDRAGLLAHYPYLDTPGTGQLLAGGLELSGFSVAIWPLVDRLLDHLEAQGARFHWTLPATGIGRDKDGLVNGIVTHEGILRAHHYVLSPGCYSPELLQGSRSAGKIMGVLGVWAELRCPAPSLSRCLKIHLPPETYLGSRPEVPVIEDTNAFRAASAAPGSDTWILGGGYGLHGPTLGATEGVEIQHLFASLQQTARHIFPRLRLTKDLPAIGQRVCSRPFSSSGLGLFEVSATAEGGRMVIAAGHNTGGFTQAPVVAEAVGMTLLGGEHPMQWKYWPDRVQALRD